MVRKDKLRGWLVIMRHVAVCNPALPFPMPDMVIEGLVANDWIERLHMGGGRVAMRLTDKGRAESDLCALDYGIDPLGRPTT